MIKLNAVYTFVEHSKFCEKVRSVIMFTLVFGLCCDLCESFREMRKCIDHMM